MKPGYYYDNARTDVITMIPITGADAILEVGGGDFPTLHRLGDELGAKTWGVDVRAPTLPFDGFVLGSVTDPAVVGQLPGSFDLIIANDVIEHVEDTEAFFRVLHDLLRPGGLLAMSVPNIRQLRTAYQLFVRGTFPRDEAGLFDRTHVRWFCKRDVMRLATDAGLTLKTWQGAGRLVPAALARTSIAEFLALQNLFVFQK